MSDARRSGELPWLRPDTKTQVTIEYKHDQGCCRASSELILWWFSAQHSEDISTEQLRKEIKSKIIEKVIPAKYLDDRTVYHIQPSGLFIIGGPQGDAGLTGRKIIVDTYGGWGAHGGGAFSGKDYSKVDRSAAYLARWIAKSLVKAGLARRALVQLSYAIGVAEPHFPLRRNIWHLQQIEQRTGRNNPQELRPQARCHRPRTQARHTFLLQNGQERPFHRSELPMGAAERSQGLEDLDRTIEWRRTAGWLRPKS